ncbi:hypothetical protein PoB_003056300 [Plakobranchus ocellatus]|uniref:Uncharacterized protein n=1 Tax=Plakobranchus ocellatus TaxID=259542 RepID=A0AAV4AA04_9GAST|nr:hypothetical protein PoB_003056300 [Plakobranchus ocellatus]
MTVPKSDLATGDAESDNSSSSTVNSNSLLHPGTIVTAKTSATDEPLSTKPGASGSNAGRGSEDEEEEITETKIIGVTETGVIRKRSFKRKLTKEERDKRGYGNDRAEYDKITERVMSERLMSSALDGLRDRGRMLAFMHGDCLALLEKWDQKRQEKLLRRQNQDRDFLISLIFVSVALLISCWMIWKFVW